MRPRKKEKEKGNGMDSGRSSVISSIIASICIVLYIAALASGVIRIIADIGDRRVVAEQEFNDLADVSSSAAILGFMSAPYQEAIRDALHGSRTLLGVIISGSGGEYAFERYPGSVVAWAGDSPRFKTGFGLPSTPFYRSIRLEGQRNGGIQGAYSYLDYDNFTAALRNTLCVILIALCAAVLTLILETAAKRRDRESRRPLRAAPRNFSATAADDDDGEDAAAPPEEEAPPPPPRAPRRAAPSPEKHPPSGGEGDPKGLFSPRGNIGWESYTRDRLESELHRCASFEQDLVFIMMECKDGALSDPLYKAFAEEAVNFFTLRDLIFEKGGQGIAVISPNIDLEQGFLKTEEFRERILKKLPPPPGGERELCAGLSSRSGRLIEAERLMFETAQALRKALADPLSPVVAFKSDPEKYRDFIRKTRSP
jgi:hypothetical protein